MMGLIIALVIAACMMFAIFEAIRMTWRSFPGWIFFLSTVLCIVLAYFLAANVAVKIEPTVPDWAKWGTNRIVHIVTGSDPTTSNSTPADSAVHAEIIASTLSVLLAGNTLWFVVIVPVFVINKLRQDVKAGEVVEVSAIGRQGYDDIRTLYSLLQSCDKAIMFAGSFDWILKGPSTDRKVEKETAQFKQLITKLIQEKKIKFVSTIRSKDQIKKSLGAIDPDFAKIFLKRFYDRSQRQKKALFTFLQLHGSERAFCSRVGEFPEKSTASQNNIIVRSTTPGGRVLNDIIENLLEPFDDPT